MRAAPMGVPTPRPTMAFCLVQTAALAAAASVMLALAVLEDSAADMALLLVDEEPPWVLEPVVVDFEALAG